MKDIGLLNLRWSQALVDGLAAAGLRELVLSPGSRSTPLALAFLRQPLIRCHVILDERSAAFFALGLAKASRQPAAVLCTSGSAPANWFPAVIEASQSTIPLLLISADRPPEQHGWGANQTIDQQGLFGRHVRAFHDPGAPHENFNPNWLQHLTARLLEECRWPLAGPVHLNQSFREPLLPTVAADSWPKAQTLPATAQALPRPLPDASLIARTAETLARGAGVIVCGESDYPTGFADSVSTLAQKLACPILAEPLSGLRFGAHDRQALCVRYDSFLRDPAFVAAHRPAWILRFGAFPVTRTLQNWLASHAAAEHLVVASDMRWADPQYRCATRLLADPKETCDCWHDTLHVGDCAAPGEWLADFLAAEKHAEALARRHLAEQVFEPALIAALMKQLPDGYQLFCGNSLAIRALDAFSGSAAKALRIFGQRGASGIDGNISTALGIAAAAGPCVAVLGDLSTQHDLGALANAAGLPIVLVVFNNGGGGIFEHLPQAGLAERQLFERAWLTPQRIDFAAAAATFAIAYAHAETLPDFTNALDSAISRASSGAATLLEVCIDRKQSLAGYRALWKEAEEKG